jgi:hypothetical protein
MECAPRDEEIYREDAETCVIPDLEKLLAEDPQWHFPPVAIEKIATEIERMRRGEYLP